MKELLLKKIDNKEIVVGVVGLGYVGLPLAVEKAKAGFKTIGFDVQQSKVDMVNKANEHKQIILRNNDGLYVITPSLNKSFKFESTWPDNSSQSYILSSLIKDIKNDNNKEISKNEDGYIIKTTVNYPNNEELKYQKIYLNKDFNLHKVEVYGNDIVKIKFQVEDLDLKAGLSTDLFDLKKYVQVEETDCKDEECTEKQTMGSIETAIYPLYMPSETYLSSSETVNTDDNSRVILTYSGGKNFVLVEEGAIKSQEHEIIPVYGEPVILNDTIAALSTNSIYWTSNNIDYYMASEDLSLKEMISIASSMNNSKNVVIVSDYLFSDSIQYDCYTENFRKEIGVVNRKLAKIADTVVECSYGNIIYHKGKVI